MQTAHADRQTRAQVIVVTCYRDNVVALYHGKVVTWWRGEVPAGARAGGQGSHVRAREAESWRKLAGS